MNDKTVDRAHWSFWAIGAVALIWNVMGGINFFMQMNADMLAAYSVTERAVIEGRPAWATSAFAIAVFGGAFGCLLLLLRKSAAYYMFIASLLGVIVTHIHTLNVFRSAVKFGHAEIVAILMTLVVAAFLIWYSMLAKSKGWVS